MLRRIHGPMVEQGLRRMRTNQELKELYKNRDIVTYINKKRLQWVEHVVRMDQEGKLRRYLRVNRREVEEREDLDWDGWKM
jgi:hypothetical protein